MIMEYISLEELIYMFKDILTNEEIEQLRKYKYND